MAIQSEGPHYGPRDGVCQTFSHGLTDLPPFNSTASRERIWWWSKPREAAHATRTEWQKGKKTAEGTPVRKAVGAGRTNQISMDDLLAAKSVSGAFGGTDKAIAALQALKQFES